MTALVKAVIERVGSAATTPANDPAPAATGERSPGPISSAAVASGRITLQPQAGAMQVLATVPDSTTNASRWASPRPLAVARRCW